MTRISGSVEVISDPAPTRNRQPPYWGQGSRREEQGAGGGAAPRRGRRGTGAEAGRAVVTGIVSRRRAAWTGRRGGRGGRRGLLMCQVELVTRSRGSRLGPAEEPHHLDLRPAAEAGVRSPQAPDHGPVDLGGAGRPYDSQRLRISLPASPPRVARTSGGGMERGPLRLGLRITPIRAMPSRRGLSVLQGLALGLLLVGLAADVVHDVVLRRAGRSGPVGPGSARGGGLLGGDEADRRPGDRGDLDRLGPGSAGGARAAPVGPGRRRGIAGAIGRGGLVGLIGGAGRSAARAGGAGEVMTLTISGSGGGLGAGDPAGGGGGGRGSDRPPSLVRERSPGPRPGSGPGARGWRRPRLRYSMTTIGGGAASEPASDSASAGARGSASASIVKSLVVDHGGLLGDGSVMSAAGRAGPGISPPPSRRRRSRGPSGRAARAGARSPRRSG